MHAGEAGVRAAGVADFELQRDVRIEREEVHAVGGEVLYELLGAGSEGFHGGVLSAPVLTRRSAGLVGLE